MKLLPRNTHTLHGAVFVQDDGDDSSYDELGTHTHTHIKLEKEVIQHGQMLHPNIKTRASDQLSP